MAKNGHVKHVHFFLKIHIYYYNTIVKKFKIIRSTTNSHVNGNSFFIKDVSIRSLHDLPLISNIGLCITEFDGDRLVLKNSHITVICKLLK
jgi:hypothetical protein